MVPACKMGILLYAGILHPHVCPAATRIHLFSILKILMLKFIKKIVLFFSVLIVAILTGITVLTVLNKQLLKDYALNNIHTILIGDSHMEMGMNDKLFPNSVNLAKSSDGYIHTYAKLQAILKSNPHINTVVVSYSAHNLSSYFHTFIYGRDGRFGFADYFPVLPSEAKMELLKHNHSLGIHSLSLILKSGFNNLFAESNHYSFLGSYFPRHYFLEDTAGIRKRINTQFYNKEKLIAISAIQLKYLKKIIDLCSDNKIKLVLLELPLHAYYYMQLPDEYIRKAAAAIADQPVVFMHCRELRLPDSLYLPDGDHVNAKGADTATKYIYQKLMAGDHLRK
jgi:hypothetical protein